MKGLAWVVEKQAQAIGLLSETVDGLFEQLVMHLECEDIGKLPEIDKTGEASAILRELEGGPDGNS